MFDFFNSLSATMQILLGLVPAILAIASVVLRLSYRPKGTAGYVCNGSQWMLWFFVIYIGSVAAQYGVDYLPESWFGKGIFSSMTDNTTHEVDNSVLWYIVYATVGYFVCYFLVAFRPVTDKQLESAKKAGKTVVNMPAQAAVSVGTLLGAFLSTMVSALLGTLFLILSGVTGCIIVAVIIMPIFGTLALFGTLILVFVTGIVVWVVTVFKFLKNLYVTMRGPAAVAYAPKDMFGD